MKQDVGFFDVGSQWPDLVIENGDLKADNGLQTASLISMFSDKRITLEELPRGYTDQRGWWADAIADVEDDKIGSKFWVLVANGKLSDKSPIELENIMRDAFEWLLDDGIAASVDVSAARDGSNNIVGSATISKPSGQNIPFKFIWDGQKLKLFEE